MGHAVTEGALRTVAGLPAVRVLSRLDGTRADSSERSTALPDTSLAVGLNSLLTSSDDVIRFMTRQGGESVERLGADLFDEQLVDASTAAVFDRLSGRAFLASVTTSRRQTVVGLGTSLSNQLYGLSKSGPLPNRGWCAASVTLDVVVGDPQVHIGVGERWVAVTIRPRGVGKAAVAVFDKMKLVGYDSNDRCAEVVATVFDIAAADRGIAPAVHTTRSLRGKPPLYLVSSTTNAAGADQYSLWTIIGSSKPRLRRKVLDAAVPYDAPPDDKTAGGPAFAIGDGGMASVAYRGGRLWAVHSVACPKRPRRACARLLSIDPRAKGKRIGVIATSTLVGKGAANVAMPGIAVNKNNDVAVAFLRATRRSGPTFAAAILARGESEFGPARTLVRSECRLTMGLSGAPSGAVQVDVHDDLGFWVNAPRLVAKGGCAWEAQTIQFVRADVARPPTEVLGAGELMLPFAPALAGPGFHERFDVRVPAPGSSSPSAGARLVVRLSDASRPSVECDRQHPLSGCATLDYPEPNALLRNFVEVETTAGRRTYHFADSQLLGTEIVPRPG